MIRPALAVVAAICALSGAPGALACVSLVPAERFPGETEAQLIDRARRMHQVDLRARADSVFLGQVSAARMVGQIEADYTLTPIYPLYDIAAPTEALVLRGSPLVSSCSLQPELGRIYVVYAERTGNVWRVIDLIQHADLQDRPPGMPTARDLARGLYLLPNQPE